MYCVVLTLYPKGHTDSYLMKQRPSWQDRNRWDGHELPEFNGNPKPYYRIHEESATGHPELLESSHLFLSLGSNGWSSVYNLGIRE